MNKLILLATSGILAVAFPVLAQASDVSAGQQQQQQQNVSTSVVAFNGIDGFDFGGDDFNASLNQVVNVETNVSQQQQQQQLVNVGDTDNGNTDNGGITQNQTQDQNGQNQQQQQGDQTQTQTQNQKGQQQQQQQQIAVAKTVSTPPAQVQTQSGQLPNAGADAGIPFALATLGTSVAAYLKHKKQMLSLSFMQ